MIAAERGGEGVHTIGIGIGVAGWSMLPTLRDATPLRALDAHRDGPHGTGL